MDPNTCVLAVDPGKTTGYALWIPPNDIQAGQAEFFDFLVRTEAWLLQYGQQTKVVAERFIINQGTVKNTQAPWSLEVIGALRYLALKHGSGELVMQSPSDAKRFSSDDRLKRLDWWQRGQGHANDALRHLLLFLVNQRVVEPPL